MSKDEFRPRKIDERAISISDFDIPTNNIGCYLSVEDIIRYWHQLEKEDFPLVHISSLLIALEYVNQKKKNITLLLPFPVHIVRMVDAIYCAKFINRGEQRINCLKKQLCSLIKESIDFPERQQITSNHILKTLITITDEFRVAYDLQRLRSTLRFNTEKGPDILLDGININVKIEAKSKLNRKYIGEIGVNDNLLISLDESLCLRLLSRDAFKSGTIEEAFDEQIQILLL